MKCPKCGEDMVWMGEVYIIIKDVDKYYYNLSKKAFRSKDIELLGVDWGRGDLFCPNYLKCGNHPILKNPKKQRRQTMSEINRQDIIERLKKAEDVFKKNDATLEATGIHYAIELVESDIEIPTVEPHKERPQGEWITDRQPDKNGTYLCVVTVKGSNVYFRNILSYATDLYEIDNFDFQKYRYKKKTDRAGWYDLDSEYGYIHYEDDEVVAWMELPELPEQFRDVVDNEITN